jgi:hypothetical protein
VKKEKIRETGSNQIIGASNEQIWGINLLTYSVYTSNKYNTNNSNTKCDVRQGFVISSRPW